MWRSYPRSIALHDRIWRVRWECSFLAWRGADIAGWIRNSRRGREDRPCRVRSSAFVCAGVTGKIADAAAPLAIVPAFLPNSPPGKQSTGGAPLRRRPHARRDGGDLRGKLVELE